MTQRCCFFKYFLLFFVVFLQLLGLVFADAAAAVNVHGYKNASNNSLILDGHEDVNHGYILDGLSFDDGQVDTQPMGPNIELQNGRGRINLTLSTGDLQFEVCSDKCGGDVTSKICYEYQKVNAKAIGSCSRFSSCEFNVTGESDMVNFGNSPILKNQFPTSCLSTMMQFKLARLPTGGNLQSCDPKIDYDNDNMVQLWVDINPLCPIRILNAKIHVPKIASTPLPSSSPTEPPSKETTESSEAALPWWAIFIIVFVGVLAFIGVGLTAYCIYKKHQRAKQSSPPPPVPVDPTPVTAVPSVAAAASVPTVLETSAKRRGNLNFTKFQPSLERPKKDKKKKETEEQPSTSEDEEAPPPQLYPPSVNPKGEAFMRRTIPQGLKSVKTDSLDQTTKKDKGEMAEAIPVSTGRHCLKSDDSGVLAQMKENYPEVQHRVLKVEIDLLCGRVSEMYQGLNTIATAAEQTLASVRCKFDQHHRLHSVTADGRRLLQDKDTAASTVYFAFGAEYHQYITEDPALLKKASVPLLMVIALQPRFAEMFRRKACAIMRRKLYRILGYYKAADRATMHFPINVLESAYCRDSKLFYHLSEIQTDSEDKKKKAAQKMKQENFEVKRAGEKQRKKQSKKH